MDLTLHLIEGWTLATAPAEDEPRVRDLDLAERLGFDRPRDIRKLIERHRLAGNLNDSDLRATVARRRIGLADQDVTEFWLTEEAALFVVTKSETPSAIALTSELIRVFLAARRRLRPEPAPDARAALLEGARAALGQGDVVGARRHTSALLVLLGEPTSVGLHAASKRPGGDSGAGTRAAVEPAVDPWLPRILGYLVGLPVGARVSTGDVLSNALDIASERQTRWDQSRAGLCLARAGWVHSGRLGGSQEERGARTRVYQRAADAVDPERFARNKARILEHVRAETAAGRTAPGRTKLARALRIPWAECCCALGQLLHEGLVLERREQGRAGPPGSRFRAAAPPA